jgi:hypothetical protein
MKTNRLTLKVILLSIILSPLLFGCQNCHIETYETYSYNPIYLDQDSLESLVEVMPPRDVERPGGIYYKDGFVYVLELGPEEDFNQFRFSGPYEYDLHLQETGIHVIDDTNPANPVNIAFIIIPGVNGMAAKGDQLFADSFTDLLVFDIADALNPKLDQRVKNVYNNLSYGGIYVDETYGIIVGYDTTPVIYENEVCDDEEIYYAYDDFSLRTAEGGGGVPTSGVAGSMARFVTVGDYLYNIDYSELHLFDISGETPNKIGDIYIGWEIETIYPYKDKLFFGAVDGMFIYDNSDPTNPTLLSKYEHVTSCDPVVVKDDYAYVTLRSGSTCQGFTNQLDIVDVSDAENPHLVKTYPMQNPHGLSIYGNCLYICEGDFGFKSFTLDFNDPTAITLTNTDPSIHAFDVITLPNLLMIVGNDGFYQYSRNCGSALEYLGVISF